MLVELFEIAGALGGKYVTIADIPAPAEVAGETAWKKWQKSELQTG